MQIVFYLLIEMNKFKVNEIIKYNQLMNHVNIPEKCADITAHSNPDKRLNCNNLAI